MVHSSADSLASVVVRKPATPQPQPQSQLQPQLQPQLLPLVRGRAFVPLAVVDDIRTRAGEVAISSDIRRYLLDIVVFLRMHRAVKSGVTAQATIDFEVLVKCVISPHYPGPALHHHLSALADTMQVSGTAARTGLCHAGAGEPGRLQGLLAPHPARGACPRRAQRGAEVG